jgi:hypothetical protein
MDWTQNGTQHRIDSTPKGTQHRMDWTQNGTQHRMELTPTGTQHRIDLTPNGTQPRMEQFQLLQRSLFGVESILSSVNSEFSPFRVRSILSSIHSKFSPLWVQSIRGWVHSGLGPFEVQSIQDWVFLGSVILCRFSRSRFSRWILFFGALSFNEIFLQIWNQHKILDILTAIMSFFGNKFSLVDVTFYIFYMK